MLRGIQYIPARRLESVSPTYWYQLRDRLEACCIILIRFTEVNNWRYIVKKGFIKTTNKLLYCNKK